MSRRPQLFRARLAWLLAAAALVGAGCGAQPAGPTGQVAIGAVFGITEGIAAYGVSQRQGIELAAAHLNAAGGLLGQPVRLVFEDSGASNEGAVNAVRKLMDKDRVVAIVGPTLSAQMFAAGKVATEEGVPILGVSNTADGITAIGEYVFRNSLPESQVLPATVARSVEKFGLRQVAVIHDAKDDFSVSGYHTFLESLQAHGVRVLIDVSYQTQDTNFDAQITAMQEQQPDAVIVSGLYAEAALLLQQMRHKGLSAPVIGGNGFNSPKLIEIAGSAAEGAVVGSPWYAGQTTPAATRFVADYTELHGHPPDQFAAQAYDGLMLVAEAMRRAGRADREAVRDALAAVTDVEGVLGAFSFDADRNPVQTPFVLQVKDGEYTELQ